jgi:hypothetical protein
MTWWKRLQQWMLEKRMWLAVLLLRNARTVVVNAEDWADMMDTSVALQQYVHTSGHLNNGRHKSRDKLRYLSNRLRSRQHRFIDPMQAIQPVLTSYDATEAARQERFGRMRMAARIQRLAALTD